MKKIIKEILPYVLIIGAVVLFRTYIATPVIVSGKSMHPNFQDGEMLIVRKVGYSGNKIKRFDVVIVNEELSNDKGEEIIKRIIGLPGEHISYKNNKLYVNDELVESDYKFYDTNDFNLEEICTCSTIPKGKYLILGDNRPISKDSRTIGLIDEKDILGKAIFRLFPISNIGNIYK